MDNRELKKVVVYKNKVVSGSFLLKNILLYNDRVLKFNKKCIKIGSTRRIPYYY